MPRRLICLSAFLIVLSIGPFSMPLAGQELPVPEVPFPKGDIGLATLQSRQKAQLEAANQFKVFYRFQFKDELQRSGITFRHRVLPYAAEQYMQNHYDHGTGLAVADVDGDGLYDIYFVNQVGGNELWKNLGNGKFKNITEEAGVGLKDRISASASFADIDNSGHEDLFVTTVDQGNVLFQNDGHGHFKDITQEAGVGLAAHSSGAVFFDYDNDGLVDLLVCNVGVYTSDKKGAHGEYVGLPDAFHGHLHQDRFEHPVLYKNTGHYKFKDVTAEVGLNPHGWAGDATFADVNGDGWPDIYFLNMQGANHYFENEGGKKFVEKTAEYFPRTPWGAMGVKFFDYDNDGRMDLIVTDVHSDMMTEIGPTEEEQKVTTPAPEAMLGAPANNFIFGNAFFHNLGSGKYEEISDKIGVEQLWPWGVSVADINADGWEDIFITAGMNFPFRYGINSMLLNNHGEKFLDSEFLLGIEPRKQPYTPWFTIDCTDQRALSTLNKLVCAGQFQPITVTVPKASRSSAVFDLDNDGDLDIVTNDFNSEPQILVSDLAQVKKIHWVKVVLTGTKSNRNGLGATVRLHAAGQTYTRYNDGKSGYLSQSALPLYFGLGDATKIDSIEVNWPSGREQVLRDNLQENQTLTIIEPAK
jgi:enediyne biosynthesis protein E4